MKSYVFFTEDEREKLELELEEQGKNVMYYDYDNFNGGVLYTDERYDDDLDD